MTTERRLAAIMFTEIVGYTALMARDEEQGLRVRQRNRSVVRTLVEQYHGDRIEETGTSSSPCSRARSTPSIVRSRFRRRWGKIPS
jgi:class 3 adenylate cyclase